MFACEVTRHASATYSCRLAVADILTLSLLPKGTKSLRERTAVVPVLPSTIPLLSMAKGSRPAPADRSEAARRHAAEATNTKVMP